MYLCLKVNTKERISNQFSITHQGRLKEIDLIYLLEVIRDKEIRSSNMMKSRRGRLLVEFRICIKPIRILSNMIKSLEQSDLYKESLGRVETRNRDKKWVLLMIKIMDIKNP